MSIIWKTCIMSIFTPFYFIILSAFNNTFNSGFFARAKCYFTWFNNYFNLLTLLTVLLISLIITSCTALLITLVITSCCSTLNIKKNSIKKNTFVIYLQFADHNYFHVFQLLVHVGRQLHI